jgi:hypothetical protein
MKSGTMWFEKLTGFKETSPDVVRANLDVTAETITSRINGRSMVFGHLETPSLEELRLRALKAGSGNGRLVLSEVVSDVQRLHADARNAGALFQVASQFNLLEMVSPSYSPEDGIGIYQYDPTQGPACAVAAGAGTIYRNYFVEVNGRIGQSAENQIDCLRDMGNLLGNTNDRLWEMLNGYALASEAGLTEISGSIASMTEPERDTLRQALRIGIQWGAEVTLTDCRHTVSQAFCSALPVAYSAHSAALWADFAALILEASYEATLYAAVLNLAKTGNNKVFLTALGGGAFGNSPDWIFAAIQRAIQIFADYPLHVVIVSYAVPNHRIQDLRIL